MFIVGALIALFAGIAIINIQQQFESNKRKAMIGEARQLGTAMGFAKLDTDVYPRIAFLPFSDRQMQFEAQNRSLAPFYLYGILDYTGIGTGATNEQIVRMRTNWQGPYFAASQSRAGTIQGRGGFVQMTIPEVGGDPFRWPADAYSNPWVLYLVSIDTVNNRPYFINGNPPDAGNPGSPTTDADYLTAIVSYGRNRVPGGGPQIDPGSTGAGALPLRLFTGDFRGQEFTSLTFFEYNLQRAAAISTRFGVGALPPNEDGVPAGILDPGSDDIVYEF